MGYSNLQEGRGETSGEIHIEIPKSPEGVIETKLLRNPDQGSAVKPPSHSPSKPIKISPPDQEIPEDFWHLFDQMENNQNQNQRQT